ncbi:MAG TPA: glycosyl hydrolase family 18 protein [Ignavibacteriaceae bacterium]|nr:glycosyl hydrolase family 18 protein [Ignavibacteriaceae bacterium]
MKKLYLVLFLFVTTSYSQEHQSIHYMDYINNPVVDEPNEQSTIFKVAPLNLKKVKNTSAVFGYLPDWEYVNSRRYLRYDLLTHIACFDFAISSTGSITNPSYWPWTGIIDTAHQNGVKIILTAVCFDTAAIRNLLTNSTVKQTFFNNLKSKIIQYSLDGVNIDFESMGKWLRGSIMNTFMLDLTNFMHIQVPGSEVSFAGPAVNWGGWDLLGLSNSCDYIFIMGYDFYGSWSTTTGPTAPFTGGTYNISNTINTQYATVIQNNPQKLILGNAYFGTKFKSRTSLPRSAVQSWVSSTRVKDDIVNVSNYGRQWDLFTQTPWYRWQLNDTTWYQVWYDDDSSMSLKYNLAWSKNLKGIGMWALGYDGSRNEMWNLIQRYTPVELTLLQAEIENNNVLLCWFTSTELNNYGFQIERKSLGQEFEIIAFVKGAGSTTSEKNYNYYDNNLNPGNYSYRLKQLDFNGNYRYYNLDKEIMISPIINYFLSQNYPNPFNPETIISYSIPEKTLVKLNIFNSLGEKVQTIINEVQEKGNHQININLKDFPSGIYFYTLQTGLYQSTKKMILLK